MQCQCRKTTTGCPSTRVQTPTCIQTCEPGYQDHDCDEQTECMRCNPGGTGRWHSWPRCVCLSLLMMTLTQQQNVRRAWPAAAEEGHAGACTTCGAGQYADSVASARTVQPDQLMTTRSQPPQHQLRCWLCSQVMDLTLSGWPAQWVQLNAPTAQRAERSRPTACYPCAGCLLASTHGLADHATDALLVASIQWLG